jgi:uncharacterized SAM-binding protein YcdF (DUF218 family)
MFFVASKVLGALALPSDFLVALGLVGALLLATRRARLGLQFLVASIVLLAICGLSPFGNALMLPLESRFPRWDSAHGPPDGIVMLGGAFDTTVALARREFALNEAAERVTGVAALARAYPSARILLSGGSGQVGYEGESEARLAARLLETLGISVDRLLLEDRSRDTGENARFSKALANPQPNERWLLVTSAHHMPRAIGAFRRAGFEVEACPVDWRTRGLEDLARPFITISDGLKRTDTAVHEWIGLVLYWITGQSSELFPAPRR